MQDQIDVLTKTNKNLANDLLKCTDELVQTKQFCDQQREEIVNLNDTIQKQINLKEELTKSTKNLEGKIIVLEDELKNEKNKCSNLKNIEQEKKALEEELKHKKSQLIELKKLNENLESKLEKRENEIQQNSRVRKEYDQLKEVHDNLKHQSDIDKQTIETLHKEIVSKDDCISSLENSLEEQVKLNKELKQEHSEKVISLELALAQVNHSLTLAQDDLKTSNSKFEEYKLKVANVLKDNKSNNFNHTENTKSLQTEIDKLQEEKALLV